MWQRPTTKPFRREPASRHGLHASEAHAKAKFPRKTSSEFSSQTQGGKEDNQEQRLLIKYMAYLVPEPVF